MSIDINRLGPAAREQIRRQLEEQRKRKATEDERRGIRDQGSGIRERETGDGGRGRTVCAPTDGGTGGQIARATENKLHAVRTDGYASKHEAERAAELKWLEKAGKISNLREQVKFVLTPAIWEEIPQVGKKGQPIKPKRKCIQREQSYFADFVYIDETGHTVVEDAKGYKGGATYRVFKNKAKVMLDKYGIKVVEV